MADPYTAALIVPGVVLAALALRQYLAASALIFTAGHLVLGLGTAWPPGFNRATGALSLGPVLAGIALVQCVETVAGPSKFARWFGDLFLGAVVALLLWVNVGIYLTHDRTAADTNSQVGRLALHYAQEYRIHLVSWPLGLPGNDGLRLLVSGSPIEQHRTEDPAAYVEQAIPTGADLFIIKPEDGGARAAVLRRFPHARLEPWPTSTSPSVFLAFVDTPP